MVRRVVRSWQGFFPFAQYLRGLGADYGTRGTPTHTLPPASYAGVGASERGGQAQVTDARVVATEKKSNWPNLTIPAIAF